MSVVSRGGGGSRGEESNALQLAEFAARLNADSAAELRGALRLYERGVQAMRAALLNPEWIVNPNYDEIQRTGLKFPTLLHMQQIASLDFMGQTDKDSEEARRCMADLLAAIASGQQPIVLSCFRCGRSKSKDECCVLHRTFDEPVRDCIGCVRAARS